MASVSPSLPYEALTSRCVAEPLTHHPHSSRAFHPCACRVLASRYIEEPHLILRKALIRGDRLSTMAHDLGVFIGRTLFFTSNLHLTGPEKREKVC